MTTTRLKSQVRRAASSHPPRARTRRRQPHKSEAGGGGWADFARSAGLGENYAPRVLSGDFEPSAVKARLLARARGQTLHGFAHELGMTHAARPPLRPPIDLDSINRTRLAEKTGRDVGDVSRFLGRRHPPTLRKLAVYADALGVWCDDLLAALGW